MSFFTCYLFVMADRLAHYQFILKVVAPFVQEDRETHRGSRPKAKEVLGGEAALSRQEGQAREGIPRLTNPSRVDCCAQFG